MGVPFECDLCHFRNMNGRSPAYGDKKDYDTLMVIRRANLDACWARETRTVTSNLGRIRRDYLDATTMFNIGNPLPYLPNPEMKDRVGMAPAIMVLSSSLRDGKYTPQVQYETVRKTVTWYGNVWDAGTEYNGVMAQGAVDKGEKDNDYISTCPTKAKWFKRFMRGVRLRMGMIRYQNEALTSDMVLAICNLAERDWTEATDESEKERIEETVAFMLLGFGAALRGEEVPLVTVDGLLHFWEETRDDPSDPFIMATLYGRFKGETGERWHCLPICDNNRSGIPFRRWIGRLLNRRRKADGVHETGWLFEKDGRRGRLADYDDGFVEYIERVHAGQPELFSKGTLLYMFSLWRSPRRGAVLETTGRVDITIVNLMNRWRIKEGAKGSAPGLTMRQTYTQVRDTLSQLKLYSKAL